MGVFVLGEQIKVGPENRRGSLNLNEFIDYLIDRNIIDKQDLIDYIDAKIVMRRLKSNE